MLKHGSERQQLQAARWLLKMELARRRTLEFCAATKSDWITARHHRLLCAIADDLISGRTKRVIISLPPRHTKSEIFSIRMPARHLGVYPDRQLLHVSYASSLSNDFSRQVRSLVRDDPTYRMLFPRVVLDPERQRLDDWKTTLGGGFKSTGVGGGISGHGAHGIIIDDCVKEGDQYSPTTLDQHFEWYLSAARTRLAPGGWVCIVMTRWSVADLVGRLRDLELESPKADKWVYINLPALAGEHDLLGRLPGEALWPERYSEQDLLAQKALSEGFFESLYQQNPQPADTKKFFASDFKRYSVTPDAAGEGAWCFDLAITKDEQGDFTSWGRWEMDRQTKVMRVAYIERKRQEWPETKRDIVDLLTRFPLDVFCFPKQTYELMAVQELRRLQPDFARRIREVSLPGDKLSRAEAFADVVKNGRAFVEEGALGDAFIREHDRFPDRHDDMVDVSSVATHFYGMHHPFGGHFADERPLPKVGDPVNEYWDSVLGERW